MGNGSDSDRIHNMMPSILDREIKELDQDQFGHKRFVEELASLIEAHEPPYSLGLLGKWGTGKSSIKSIYETSIKNDVTKKDKIYPITFNAWKYGGSDIKKAFLKHVYIEIGGDEERVKEELYSEITKSNLKKRPWIEFITDLKDKWWFLLQITTVFTFAILFLQFLKKADTFEHHSESLFMALSVCFSIILIALIKYLFSPDFVKRLISPRYSHVISTTPPLSGSEQYEYFLKEQLTAFKTTKIGRKCERIVIFVDDLDRLSADEMVTGLDTIRIFLEIKLGENAPGIVFVISCDEQRVADAIARRGAMRNPDMPGVVTTMKDARRFLDRIFQFRLEIPPFPKQDMRTFALDKIKKEMPSIQKDIEQSTFELETLVDRMIHPQVQSPRNAIQILNAFASSWWLAKQREKDGSGSDISGGLKQGTVTEYPEALAAVSALKVDFPDFYDDLYEEPQLIFLFDKFSSKLEDVNGLPERARYLLEKYYMSKKTDDGNIIIELRKEFRDLRQFLSGIQDVLWPKQIKPLLLLNQDRISRSMGDNARILWEALVQGDHVGVLEALGRKHDEKMLSSDDTRLIANLMEDLKYDSKIYQDNAARVVANIAPRLSDSDKTRLLSPLARRLSESHKLRCFLGVERIKDLLSGTYPEDRKLVTQKLCDDLLRFDAPINFTLTGGQEPSLDQGIEIVNNAVEMALDVLEKDGLDEPTSDKLFKWLQDRQIIVGKKGKHLEFNYLENWITRHESVLLLKIGLSYTNELIVWTKADETLPTDQNTLINRFKEIFSKEWEKGEDSQKEIWDQVQRCIGLRPKAFVNLGLSLAMEKKDSAGNDVYKICSTSIINRIEKALQDSYWELPNGIENGIAILLEWMRSKTSKRNTEVSKKIGVLSLKLGSEENTFSQSRLLLDYLFELKNDEGAEDPTDPIIENWTNRIFSDLPEEGIIWLSKYFGDLLETEQTRICSVINTNLQNPANDKHIFDKGKTLLHDIEGSQFENTVLTNCVTNLLNFTIQQLTPQQNNVAYLEKIFPVFPKILQYCPQNLIGNLLQQAFDRSQGHPNIHGLLHDEMIGYWPKSDTSRNPYNPEQCFSFGLSVATNNPSMDYSPHILFSLKSMIENNIVSKDREMEVLKLASTIWPHFMHEAKECFLKIDLSLSPSEIATMLSATDETDDEAIKSAFELLSYFKNLQSNQEMYDTGMSILSKAPVTDDKWLSIWIDAVGDARDKIIVELLKNEGLTEEQILRVFAQFEKHLDKINFETLKEIVFIILTREADDRTCARMMEIRDRINSLLTNESQKHDLSNNILNGFVSTKFVDRKKWSAKWIKELGTSAIIRNQTDQYTLDDLEILIDVFPSYSSLKKLRRKLEKEA